MPGLELGDESGVLGYESGGIRSATFASSSLPTATKVLRSTCSPQNPTMEHPIESRGWGDEKSQEQSSDPFRCKVQQQAGAVARADLGATNRKTRTLCYLLYVRVRA